MTTTYTVTWGIEVEANSPRDAALAALEIQRNPYSSALVFDTHNWDTDEDEIVDLEEVE